MIPSVIIDKLSETRKNDEIFLENFITKEESLPTLKVVQNSSNISGFKTTVNSISNLNDQLAPLIGELQGNSLSKIEWNEKMTVCEKLKEQIKSQMANLEQINMSALKKQLEKRKKMRERQKERKKKWTLRKKLMQDRRSQIELKVDNWINEKQNEINREKQEESLRKDADIVLFDVRGKRLDTKKFLSILRELESLRKVKAANARAKGEVIKPESDRVFTNIIVKLKEQWSNLDKEYATEEKGLKLMLQADKEKKISKQTRNISEEWEMTFFNTKINANQKAEVDNDDLIMKRTMWDKYLHAKGSEIPVGWVMPSEASSTAWTSLLSDNSKKSNK